MQNRKPVGLARGADLGGTVVVCDDGSVWKWTNGGVCDKTPHVPGNFHWEERCPIPGSKREEELSEG